MPAREAGIILMARGSRHFLPSAITQRIIHTLPITRVPGDGTPLSTWDGRVVTAVPLGEDAHAVLCEVDGETIALSGVAVERTGFFEAAEGGVLVEGQRVPLLSLSAELSRVREGGAA